jgi:periplasmic protein CpxP/Spy
MGRMGWRGTGSAEERAEHMVGRFADRIDATQEQKAQLTEIVRGALDDLLPLRDQLHEARGEMRTLLTAETVDRAAIEDFRVEQIELADRASRRLAEALGDAAELLTPEQRTEIGSLMERFGERHGRRHRH